MKKQTIFIFITAIVLQITDVNAQNRLIAFVDNNGSAVSTEFSKQLNLINSISAKSNLDLSVFEISKTGAPVDVTITPLLVFQNHLGRSIYQGRTNTVSRIKNFIQTSKFVAQGKKLNVRNNIPIWKIGRTRIWSPVKIVPVTGTIPNGYNHSEFVAESLEVIANSFRKFEFAEESKLGRSDRGFYMDFYPWCADDGTLFLSLALFSQFHCKEPVYELKKTPLAAPWKKRNKLFKKAALLLEKAVAGAIKKTETGDGFNPIRTTVPLVSWEDLGLKLPPPPVKNDNMPEFTNITLPQKWILDSIHADQPPLLRIRFPAPLDVYSGAATMGSARFILNPDITINNARGQFVIDAKSLSMGDAGLDKALQGRMFLNTKKYPESKFVIESIKGDGKPLAFGELKPITVSGIFTLKGISINLTPSMQIEPILGNDMKPRLIISGDFKLNLRNFNIDDADGPEPANHTLILDFYFIMKPAIK